MDSKKQGKEDQCYLQVNHRRARNADKSGSRGLLFIVCLVIVRWLWIPAHSHDFTPDEFIVLSGICHVNPLTSNSHFPVSFSTLLPLPSVYTRECLSIVSVLLAACGLLHAIARKILIVKCNDIDGNLLPTVLVPLDPWLFFSLLSMVYCRQCPWERLIIKCGNVSCGLIAHRL